MREGRVDALLVGIPGGEPLIELAHELSPRPIVIAASTCPSAEAVKRALAVGADLATTRPHDLERLAPVLLAAARLAGERVALPRPESDYSLPSTDDDDDDDDFDEGNAFASTEDFASAFDTELGRSRKFAYPIAVALFACDVPKDPPPGVRGILRARAGTALLGALRDIDVATELDQDRFLVLLPYTEVDAAAELARRAIAQVAASTPLTVAGRSFTPRVIGAVSGAQAGQPLAFERLMRSAEQALDRARKSGTDLAVES
jgi:hypothetical protein